MKSMKNKNNKNIIENFIILILTLTIWYLIWTFCPVLLSHEFLELYYMLAYLIIFLFLITLILIKLLLFRRLLPTVIRNKFENTKIIEDAQWYTTIFAFYLLLFNVGLRKITPIYGTIYFLPFIGPQSIVFDGECVCLIFYWIAFLFHICVFLQDQCLEEWRFLSKNELGDRLDYILKLSTTIIVFSLGFLWVYLYWVCVTILGVLP